MEFDSSPSFSFPSHLLFLELKINLVLLTYTSGVKKVSLVQEKRRLTKQPHEPLRKPGKSLTHGSYTLTHGKLRTHATNELKLTTKFMRIQKRRCDRGSGKIELPKQKTRVFERAKHKTTSCAPYKREKIVSSTIITFCPVNFDNTNLRKQTSVHLFMRSNYANCRRKNVPQKLILINLPND